MSEMESIYRMSETILRYFKTSTLSVRDIRIVLLLEFDIMYFIEMLEKFLILCILYFYFFIQIYFGVYTGHFYTVAFKFTFFEIIR